MPISESRKKELLKPPELKPVITSMLIIIFMISTIDPAKDFHTVSERAISAQKYYDYLANGTYLPILTQSFLATFLQLGPWCFILNSAFMWIFGTVLEKKLVGFRYPTFLTIGVLGCWAILAYDAAYVNPAQNFVGPALFFAYIIGGYFILKPKKPFKPADWKPPPWKISKVTEKNLLATPWVNPMVYVILWLIYEAFLYACTSLSRTEIDQFNFMGILTNIQHQIIGGMAPNTIQIARPLAAAESFLLGIFVAYVLVNIVFKPKLLRSAGNLQQQAVLQYRELRSLDMNHNQAVEGTARLIGVPTDIAKDWITKGLQPSQDEGSHH